jgi:hypothetical protein
MEKPLLVVAIGVIALFGLGFGLCGGYGVFTGVSLVLARRPGGVFFLIMGICGLALAAGFVMALREQCRKLFTE